MELNAAGWQSRYEAGNTGWDRGEANPQLIQWLKEGKLTGERILVPGCGRGYEPVELAKAGFHVTALDFAEAAVEDLRRVSRSNGLVIDVRQIDVFEFTADPRFDIVYEQTCLCAIHPHQWQAYERQLASWIIPSGALFALFMQSPGEGGPPFHCDEGAMKKLFDSTRWEWPSRLNRVEHPSGLHELSGVLKRR